MKRFKIILFVTCFLSVITINAQEKKATFGVKAGLNFADVTSDEGNFDNTESKIGFHAGITLDYAFTPQWYLLTGLEYTSKGVKVELNPTNQDVTAAYVQLPVSAAYKFAVSDELSILVNAGPYFAYGLHGKIKAGSHEQDTFGDATLKKFDAGVQLAVALEWKKFCFSLGGEVGVVNIMQENNSEAKTQNSALSIGYKS